MILVMMMMVVMVVVVVVVVVFTKARFWWLFDSLHEKGAEESPNVPSLEHHYYKETHSRCITPIITTAHFANNSPTSIYFFHMVSRN